MISNITNDNDHDGKIDQRTIMIGILYMYTYVLFTYVCLHIFIDIRS